MVSSSRHSDQWLNAHVYWRDVMIDVLFAVWTRRRLTLATGGLLAAIVGLRTTEKSKAKGSRRRSKRCASGKMRCGKPRCVTGTCCPGRGCGSSCSCYLVGQSTTACLHATNVDCEDAQSTCTSNADCQEGTLCATIDCALNTIKQCVSLCDAPSS